MSGEKIGVVYCADCGAELNRTTRPLSERDQMFAAMSSGLSTGSCRNGCRATFSDLNINTDIDWFTPGEEPAEGTPKVVKKDA
jgi:hypothetical protein